MEDYGDPMAVLDLTGLDDVSDSEGPEEVLNDVREERLGNPLGLEEGVEEGVEEAQGPEEGLVDE